MSFQEKVWELLKQIPEGKVTTYKIIAEKLGTKAYRAVGNACHNNPYAPEAACHRVVNSNGKTGGFRTGIKEKIGLLENEGIEVENGRIKNFDKVLFRF
ncbi:MAG: methylated-DNA--[protein]-cysteine S-methyltransferase [Candidatus Aenigmarchaeota archaeon]|nr:methylated-DNA--[protein]-cysteine S-methyltransferase [Candidatus Aenigmarchaeota archaeon]